MAAVPAAMGTRALLTHYKSRALLNLRIEERTQRLRALRQRREDSLFSPEDKPLLPAGMEYLPEE